MGLLHHVYAVYGRLGGGGARGRIYGCGTAPLARARRARRRRRRETVRGHVPPFRRLLARVVVVVVLLRVLRWVAEVEVGLGQRPAAEDVPRRVVRAARHRRPMLVTAADKDAAVPRRRSRMVQRHQLARVSGCSEREYNIIL